MLPKKHFMGRLLREGERTGAQVPRGKSVGGRVWERKRLKGFEKDDLILK